MAASKHKLKTKRRFLFIKALRFCMSLLAEAGGASNRAHVGMELRVG